MTYVQSHPDERPPDDVLRWCENLVDVCRHDGVWGVPRSQIAFRIDKKNKALVLVSGEETNPDFIATKNVFRHIGWRVIAAEQDAFTIKPPNSEATDAE